MTGMRSKIRNKAEKIFKRLLKNVPRAMPALMRANKLQKRAFYHGCHLDADAEKISALAAQAVQAEPQDEKERKVGELLFAAVCLARNCGVDPEQALQRCNERFVQQSKAWLRPE